MYVQQVEGESWREAKVDKSVIDRMDGMPICYVPYPVPVPSAAA